MIPAGEGAIKEVTRSKAGRLEHDEMQIYVENHFKMQDEVLILQVGVRVRVRARARVRVS